MARGSDRRGQGSEGSHTRGSDDGQPRHGELGAPELQLISHVDAMQFIHALATVDQVVAARERLAFEELVLLQVSLLQERNRAQRSGGEGVSIVSTSMCDELRGVLDFR